MTDSLQWDIFPSRRSRMILDSRDVTEHGPILVSPSRTVARSSPADGNMEIEQPAVEGESTQTSTQSSSKGGTGTAGYVLLAVAGAFVFPSVVMSLFFVRWFRRRKEAHRQAQGTDGHLYDSQPRRKPQAVNDRSVLLDGPNKKRKWPGGRMSFSSPLKSLYERVRAVRSSDSVNKAKGGSGAVDALNDPPDTPAETIPQTVISPSPIESPDGMIIELPVLTTTGSGVPTHYGADKSHPQAATTIPMKVSVVPTDGGVVGAGMPSPPVASSGVAGGRNTPSNHSLISDISGSLSGSRPPSRNEAACVTSPRALGTGVCGGIVASATVESAVPTGKKEVVGASKSTGTDLEGGHVVNETNGSVNDGGGLNDVGFPTDELLTDENQFSDRDDPDRSPDVKTPHSGATTPPSAQKPAAGIGVTRPGNTTGYVRSVFDYMVCTSTPLHTIPEEAENPKQQRHTNKSTTIVEAPASGSSQRTPMWGVAPSATVDSDDPRLDDSHHKRTESRPHTGSTMRESARRAETPFSQQHFESFELVLEPAAQSPPTPKNLSFDFAEAAGGANGEQQHSTSPPLATASSRGISSASTRRRAGGRPGSSFDASTMDESVAPSSSHGNRLRQSLALAAKWRSAFVPVGRAWRGSFRSAASASVVDGKGESPADGVQRAESGPADHTATVSKDAQESGQADHQSPTAASDHASGRVSSPKSDEKKAFSDKEEHQGSPSALNMRYEFRNATSILPLSGTDESDEDGAKRRTFSVESASGNAYMADDGGFSDDSTRKSRPFSMSSASGQLMHVGDVAVFDSDNEDAVKKGSITSLHGDGTGNMARPGVSGIPSSGDLEGQSEEVVYEQIYETFPAGEYEDELATTETESEPFQARYLNLKNPSVSGELGGHEVEHDEYISYTEGSAMEEADTQGDEDDAKDPDGNVAKASMGILAKKLSSGLRSLRNRRQARPTEDDDDVGPSEQSTTDARSESREHRLAEVDLEAQYQTDGDTTLEGERYIMSDTETDTTGIHRERTTEDDSLSWLQVNAKPANPPAVAPRKLMGRLFSSHRKGSTESKDEESRVEGSVGAVSSALSAASEGMADTVHTDRSGDGGESRPKSASAAVDNKNAYPSAEKASVSTPSNQVSTKKKKPMWKSAVDPSSGLTYYYHNITKETTWEKPAGFVERQPRKSPTKNATEANVTVEPSIAAEEPPQETPVKGETVEEEKVKEVKAESTKDSDHGPDSENAATTTIERQGDIRQVQTWDESKEPGPDKSTPPAVPLKGKTRSFEFDPVAWAKKIELTSMLTAMTMSEPEPVEKEEEPPQVTEEPAVRPQPVLHDIDEEAPFDEPLPSVSEDVSGLPAVVGGEEEREKSTSPLGDDPAAVPEMEETQPSSHRQASPSPSSSGKAGATDSTYDLKARVMSSKTAVSSGSGLKSQAETLVSERTQKIANTTMKIYATVKDQKENNNSVNSSFSSNISPLKTDGTFVVKATDHSHEKNLSPLRHPGGNEVPRERELKSEEYTGRLYGLTSEEFSDQNAANRIPPSRRFGTVDSSPKGGDVSTPSISEAEYESSYAGDNENDPESETWGSDSVSGLSGSELGSGRMSREVQIKKKALEAAIKMGEWERAASFADDLRSVEAFSRDSSVNRELLELAREETKVYDAETNDQEVFRQQFIKNDGSAGEWKQTELDKFISQNDWTSVAQYITHMREASPRRKAASPAPESAPSPRTLTSPPPRQGRSLSSNKGKPRSRSSDKKAVAAASRRSRSPGGFAVPSTVVRKILKRRSPARRTTTATKTTAPSQPPTDVVTQQPTRPEAAAAPAAQMPRKRFGARSQLQHDSIMSDSSWESSSQLEDVTESEEDFISSDLISSDFVSSASDRRYREETRGAQITKFKSSGTKKEQQGAKTEEEDDDDGDSNTRMGFHRRMQV